VSDASAGSAVPPWPLTGTRILAVANQKGGVGKTTTTINLGTALAAVGERVLILDIDPQGNASTGLGVRATARHHSSYDVLSGEATLAQTAVAAAVPGLWVAPASVDLAGLEIELANVPDRAFRMRNALQREAAANGGALPYSYILIDCPPSLNVVTINAMTAADALIVPLQCEFFALEGLSQLLRTVEMVRASLNRALHIQGVVLTMYDSRNRLSEQVAADVRGHFGDVVYTTVIPRNVRVSEAPSFGKPALIYDYKSAGSQAYIRLASELIQRERMKAA
jgi:chromosome partitioning protein